MYKQLLPRARRRKYYLQAFFINAFMSKNIFLSINFFSEEKPEKRKQIIQAGNSENQEKK